MMAPKEISPIIRGQIISIFITGTGVFASLLSNENCNFPTLMSAINYLLLSIFYSSKMICKHDKHELNHPSVREDTSRISNSSERINGVKTDLSMRTRQIYYFLAAIIDMEANFLVILAYKFTSITSIMLLDCFTIPSAMILSYCFLGACYQRLHIAGVFLCCAGLSIVIISDSIIENSDSSKGSNPVLGDALCICGSFLYACSNVVQESLVKCHKKEEYLRFVGTYGFIIASIQFCIVDLNGVEYAKWHLELLLLLCGFVLCLFCMYINTANMLSSRDGDSILFNLSLLTSDIYAVLFSYLAYGLIVNWLYLLAFSLVFLGILTYHLENSPTSQFAISNEDCPRASSLSFYSPIVLKDENIADDNS
jgi:solute carrier family 35 protein F1/2